MSERRLRLVDEGDVFSVDVGYLEPVVGSSLVEVVSTPPLAASELAHYQWLLAGLLDGAFALAVRVVPDLCSLPEAIDAVRELVDELMARLTPVGDR